MQQSLATPDTCVYYQVASFYHDFATAVRQASPALFDLVEGYTLATFRRNERELKATQHSLWQFIQTEKNDSSYTFDELRARMSHLGELTLTSDIMEGFCRNFPEYTDQMKVFIQRDTGDTSPVPDGAVGIRILCDLAATVGGRQNGSAPADRGYTGGRGWPPQNRAWPAPFGAAGGTGGKWRFDLPEIPQAGGRHPYPDPVQTAHRQQKKAAFLPPRST